MASFNKVILMGNLTRDPQLRFLPSNMAVCDFGLAVNRRWRDKDGNQRDEVCFVDCAAFGRTGEAINQYMAKGRALLIEGHLRLETWTGQDGQKRSKHSVTVENFQFVGPRGEGAGPSEGGGAPERSARPPERRPVEQPSGPSYDNDPGPPPSGDEIPF